MEQTTKFYSFFFFSFVAIFTVQQGFLAGMHDQMAGLS